MVKVELSFDSKLFLPSIQFFVETVLGDDLDMAVFVQGIDDLFTDF